MQVIKDWRFVNCNGIASTGEEDAADGDESESDDEGDDGGGGGDEGDGDGKSGWADAMAKVLNMGKDSESAPGMATNAIPVLRLLSVQAEWHLTIVSLGLFRSESDQKLVSVNHSISFKNPVI